MENQTKINVALVSILLLVAGYAVVGNAGLEPTHYCEEKEIKAFCYSLSSTMKTCYTEIDKSGGKRCDIWKEIGEAEAEPIQIIEGPIIAPNMEGSIWSCAPAGCIKIK